MNIKLFKSKLYDVLIVIADMILIFASSVISKAILGLFKSPDEMLLLDRSIGVAAVAYLASMLFMLYVYEFYTKTIRSKYENLLSVALAILVSGVVSLLTTLIASSTRWPISFFFFGVMAVVLFVLIGIFKLILLHVGKKIEGAPKLLVIESKDVENSLARKIKYSYLALYESMYLLIDVNSQEEIDELISVTFKQYQSIFISPDIPAPLRNHLLSVATSQRKEIYLLPDFYNISVRRNETVQFDDTPAFRLRPFGLSKLQGVFKRAMDIAVSLVCVTLSLPIMIVVAIAIKMDSEGPVIYKQQRTTKNQKVFNIYKFRTMTADAEKHMGAVLAAVDDPRITRVGKTLRSARLDELPQFFNVLWGDMSIVGPRPERPVFVEQFKTEIENYDKRFFVKAGLTGLAQVYARYDTTVKDKILYDLLYIKDYALFKDIKIILLTVKIMFVRESSEGISEKGNYIKA